MPEIEKAMDDVDILAKLFTKRKDDFKHKYGKFCMNYPKAEFILSEYEEYFNVSDPSWIMCQV